MVVKLVTMIKNRIAQKEKSNNHNRTSSA